MWRKPADINQAFYSLLLVQIELEERMTNLAELLNGVTPVEVTPSLLELERPASGEHNEGVAERDLESDEEVFSTLHYYMVQPVPGLLGVARFHASDDETGFYDVTEDVFLDTADDHRRLQQEVPEALEMGVDVLMMSPLPPEHFPKIHAYLIEASHADD